MKDLTLPLRPGDQAEHGQVYANGEMVDIEMHPDVFSFKICQEGGYYFLYNKSLFFKV